MTTFVVGDVFNIRGRGRAVSRSNEASKAAWDDGERWAAGDTAVCDETGQEATVVGVERYCVAEGHPNYFDGSLLLRAAEGEILDLDVGQTWRRRGCELPVQLPGLPEMPCGGPTKLGCPFKDRRPECSHRDMYEDL